MGVEQKPNSRGSVCIYSDVSQCRMGPVNTRKGGIPVQMPLCPTPYATINLSAVEAHLAGCTTMPN